MLGIPAHYKYSKVDDVASDAYVFCLFVCLFVCVSESCTAPYLRTWLPEDQSLIEIDNVPANDTP